MLPTPVIYKEQKFNYSLNHAQHCMVIVGMGAICKLHYASIECRFLFPKLSWVCQNELHCTRFRVGFCAGENNVLNLLLENVKPGLWCGNRLILCLYSGLTKGLVRSLCRIIVSFVEYFKDLTEDLDLTMIP